MFPFISVVRVVSTVHQTKPWPTKSSLKCARCTARKNGRSPPLKVSLAHKLFTRAAKPPLEVVGEIDPLEKVKIRS